MAKYKYRLYVIEDNTDFSPTKLSVGSSAKKDNTEANVIGIKGFMMNMTLRNSIGTSLTSHCKGQKVCCLLRSCCEDKLPQRWSQLDLKLFGLNSQHLQTEVILLGCSCHSSHCSFQANSPLRAAATDSRDQPSKEKLAEVDCLQAAFPTLRMRRQICLWVSTLRASSTHFVGFFRLHSKTPQ